MMLTKCPCAFKEKILIKTLIFIVKIYKNLTLTFLKYVCVYIFKTYKSNFIIENIY